MNFLAHLYLSGNDPEVLTGNFLGDFVKGRASLATYSPNIASGIELHRGIDTFTDTHSVVQQSKNRLRPVYRHYSGVIVDMFYDHFLGAGWPHFHADPLSVFSKNAYRQLSLRKSIMPESAQRVLPYIIQYNWLESYATIDGIDKALSGIARRSKHDSKMEQASNDLRLHYSSFQTEFDEFFPQLVSWAKQWREARTAK